jgi:hypothetical protein
MHVSAEQGRSILKKILQDLPEEREKLLEEESHTTRNVLVFNETLMKRVSQTMRLIPWFVTFICSCHIVCDETNVRECVL